MNDTGPVLRPHEVAELLRVSRETVSRWAKAGKLPSFRTLGGHRRFRAADIERLLKDGEARP